jgi:hypothetical protein
MEAGLSLSGQEYLGILLVLQLLQIVELLPLTTWTSTVLPLWQNEKGRCVDLFAEYVQLSRRFPYSLTAHYSIRNAYWHFHYRPAAYYGSYTLFDFLWHKYK